MIGQVLRGTYRLTDLIGSGGYADVYLARDLRTNTIVAVKILHSHVARDPDIAARFGREASLARRLQTPHVARVLDAGQDAASPPFMVMELVQGLTVAELIRRHGPFPIPEAVDIVDQLLSALGSAHALGIVHRDVKPQNLMIDAERRLKVLDFGIARVVGAGTMTALGHLLGTPEYMAPEQLEGRPIDHRADLYAAGAVLYQLLSGRPPYLRYADADIWELIRRVRTEPPPPIARLRPELPLALAEVVERAMAKDPDRRYQSAYEMRHALALAAGTDPPTTPQPPPATASPPGETQILADPAGAGRPGHAEPAAPAPYPSGSGQPGTPPGPYPPGPEPVGPAPPGSYTPEPYPPRWGAPRPYAPIPPPPWAGGRRSGMPAWQLVGLGVGALLLVIVGVTVGRMVPLPGGSATPTATATRVAAAATATSTVAAAEPTSAPAPPAPPAMSVAAQPTSPPTALPTLPTVPTTAPPEPTSPPPSPVAPSNPPGVLLSDNFEHPETGQLPRTSARPNDYVFAYDRGEYVINKVNAALPAAPIVFLPGSYDNSVIAVDVRIMGNVPSGYAFVVCRDQSTGGQAKQYRASIVPEGRRVILSRWDDGNQRVLAEARDEPAIRIGTAANRLELSCAGTKIAAGVNGKVVATADDVALNRGDHGLGAGTFAGVEGTLEARFDNLEVREP
jgi:serine/threonine-protein kinase